MCSASHGPAALDARSIGEEGLQVSPNCDRRYTCQDEPQPSVKPSPQSNWAAESMSAGLRLVPALRLVSARVAGRTLQGTSQGPLQQLICQRRSVRSTVVAAMSSEEVKAKEAAASG